MELLPKGSLKQVFQELRFSKYCKNIRKTSLKWSSELVKVVQTNVAQDHKKLLVLSK